MADRMTREQRHICMSHVKGKGTSPEILVRKALFAAGFRFRVNVSALPGTPDIVLRKYRTAVFVNGCFWHGHENCRLYTVPKSNTRFWEEKVRKNRRRDAAVIQRLVARGWKVVTVWECGLDSSHRNSTLAGLVEQIRANGAVSAEERAERKRQGMKSRYENRLKKLRNDALAAEVYSRYRIPMSVRKEASESEANDFPGESQP